MNEKDALAKIYPHGAGLDAGAPQNNPAFVALVAYVKSGEPGMKTKCPHCGSLSFIRSSKQLGKLVKEATCQCTNLVCGHTFIVSVEVVRTISPAAFPDPLVSAQLKQSDRWHGVDGAVEPSKTAFFGESKR
jgi:hypothetical protein